MASLVIRRFQTAFLIERDDNGLNSRKRRESSRFAVAGHFLFFGIISSSMKFGQRFMYVYISDPVLKVRRNVLERLPLPLLSFII